MPVALQVDLSVQDLIQPDGTVAIDGLTHALHMTKTDLAAVLGMSRDSLSKSARLSSIATQRKLRDFVEILTRVAPWAGSVPQAFAWFCAQPLPSFGDQTPADLVREDRADAVKSYISRIAVGGYA
jgi:uncharacterized protein (DUF2384 family)